MRLIAVCILMGFFGGVMAQSAYPPLKCHKKISARFAGDAARLANTLTSELSDDSEKVCAIYSWITANIAYDIHKAVVNDFNRANTAKIIRKKKAICLGYADLFNSLCRYAGLESVTVFGYVKSRSYDLGDTFYFSTHAWNSVKINGSWKLFDATWDAGYIEYIRQTFKGKILYVFSLGKVKKYYFKPRFIQDPGSRYYFRNGDFMAYDHLASDARWQLLDTTITPEKWCTDSTHYLGKIPDENYADGELLDYSTQDAFAKMDEQEQWIAAGFAAHRINPKDHVDIANSYGILGIKHLQEMIKDQGDDEEMMASVIQWNDSAILHYDSAMAMLKRQREGWGDLRKSKKKICMDHNKKMIVQCKQDKSKLKKSYGAINKVVNEINQFEENSDEMYREGIKYGFRKARWSATGGAKEERIRLLDSAMQALADTTTRQIDKIYALQKQIYRLWDDHAFEVQAIRDNNQEDMDQMMRRAGARLLGGYDDLDYLPSLLRDSMSMRKLMDDSARALHRATLSDSVALLFGIFTRQSKIIHKLYAKQISLWAKKKTYSAPDAGVQEDYLAFENEYYNYRKEENTWTKEWRKPVSDIAEDLVYCMVLVDSREIGLMQWEMKLEKILDKGRGESEKDYLEGIKKGLKENKKACKSNRKTAVKMLKEMRKK